MVSEDYLQTCSARYLEIEQTLKDSLESIVGVLRPYVKTTYRDHAVVSGRVKTLESLIEKLARNDKERTWEDIKDKVALKVILPSRMDVKRFVDEVQSKFPSWVMEVDEKVLPAEKMGYTSTHLDCTSSSYLESEDCPLHFEIQVRTMVQDAWYVNDHALNYKSGHKVLPQSFQRGVLRLSILTELIDEEVERLHTEKLELSSVEPLKAFEVLSRAFDETFGRPSAEHTVSDLFMTMYKDLYEDGERESFSDLIKSYLSANSSGFVATMEKHSSASETYAAHRDWIYRDPTTLLIAERASNNPVKVKRRFRNDDLSWLLTPMANEFGPKY